jgi:hypothetical protein
MGRLGLKFPPIKRQHPAYIPQFFHRMPPPTPFFVYELNVHRTFSLRGIDGRGGCGEVGTSPAIPSLVGALISGTGKEML